MAQQAFGGRGLLHTGRALKRLAAGLLAAALLASCGGGSDEPETPAFLKDVPAYGSAPPEGAQVISLAEAEALAASGTLTWVTQAERERLSSEAAQRQTQNDTRLAALLAANPELAERLGVPAPAPGLEALADGNWRVTVNPADPQSRRFVTQAQRFAVDDFVAGLREGASRANREALFKMLIEGLPEDGRQGLPTVAELGSVSDAALDAALADLTARATQSVDASGLPTTVITSGEPLTEAAGVPVSLNSGCTQFGAAGLYATQNWPLKHALTPIRDQGARGTCTAFAIAGGMEMLVRSTYGRKVDLSEQLLYGMARGPWYAGPAPAYYDFSGDGLPIMSTQGELIARSFALPAESEWSYNPALSRTRVGGSQFNPFVPVFTDSCTGYSGTCTNTNHQQSFNCVQFGTKYWCAFRNQATTAGLDAERYNLREFTWLWVEKDNLSVEQEAVEALTRARAALQWGKPVSLGLVIDRAFVEAAPASLIDDPLQPSRRIVNPLSRLTSSATPLNYGAHAVQLVGFVSFATIDATAEAANVPPSERLTWGLDSATEGGGFFIIKNSWACGWGDGGFVYATPAYLKKRTISLSALTRLDGQAPSATLVASTSSITSAAQPLRLRANGNALVRKVEFYKVEGAVPSKIGEDSSAPYENTVSFPAGTSGTQRYYAVAVDASGNRATTNVVAVNVAIGAEQAPTITSFGASPATTPPGGGAVTLSWAVSGAQSLSIGNVGSVTGQNSAVVQPNVTTTYVLSATNSGGTATASTTVTVPPPQVVSFAATPATLPAGGGTVQLSWNVAGAQSVSISGGVGSVGASGSVNVNATASTSWTLTATAPSGSSSATTAVTVAADTTAPTVALAASPTAVTAPGTTVLTASASDNIGVVAVDFLRGNTVIATDSTPGNGFTHSVSLGTADVGNVSFTAVARDAAGNSTTSVAAVVVVSLPVSTADRWVSPTGSDSNPGTLAQPYQSVGRAMATVGANGTVWLAAGTYPWANENGRNGYDQQSFKVIRLPAGVTLAAQTAGTVTIHFGLEAQGAGTVSGLRFSSATNDAGDHAPTAIATPFAGLVQLRGVSFGRVGTLIYTRGGDLTFDALGVVNHAWLDAEFQGSFGRVDLGHVRILGGVMAPTRLPDTTNVNNRGFGTYGYSGRLTFDGVTLNIPTAPAGVGQAVFLPIQGGQFAFLNGQAVQTGTPPYSVLVQSDNSSSVRIANSTVSGRFTHVVSIFAGGNVRIEDSTLYGGVYAVGPTGGDEPAGAPLPTVVVSNSTIRNFVIGVAMPNGGSLTVSDSTIRDNTAIGIALTGEPFLPYRSAVYTLSLRNSTLSGNGTGTVGHAGISMVGAATSVFDLGTAASPGNNTLTGGDPAQTGPAVRVAVPAALTVSAVGNTWGVTQGSDGSGRYSGNVVVTNSSLGASGSNFVVISGGLRLAGTP